MGAVIDNAPVQRLHYGVVALCAVCMLMDGFDVQALGYVAPALVSEWKINPALLGPVFGASNFGVLVGQLSFTVLADRIGRRPILVAGTVAFAVLTVLTGTAASVPQLLVMRFVAGMAMGSIVPNATALVDEFMPAKIRVRFVSYVGIGHTAGAVAGGFAAAWLIPSYGWRSVFYVGGVAPIALAVMMARWLPESLRLLALHGRKSGYVADWLRRLDPRVAITRETRLVVREEHKPGVQVVHLLTGGRGLATVLMWVVFFLNLFNLYSLSNWLPTIVRGAGYDTRTAVLVGTVLQVGGTVAPFILTWLVMRKGFVPVLAGTFAVAAVAIVAIGRLGSALPLLVVAVFVAGACVVGSQPSLNALAAMHYPTYLRSTGIGWALGIGRVGSIAGPLVAGQFLAWKWSAQDIFLALSVPAAVSAVMIALLHRTVGGPSD